MVAPHASGQTHFKAFPLLSTSPTAADLMLIDSFQTGTYTTKTIDWRSLLREIGVQTTDQITTNTTWFLYSSNIITINAIVSNYFRTQILGCGLNLVTTNAATNGTVAASLVYSGNPYMSNWFFTNIFDLLTDGEIYDFFFTNIYRTNAYAPFVTAAQIFEANAKAKAFFSTNAAATNDLYARDYISTQHFTLTFTDATTYSTNPAPTDAFLCEFFATNRYFTNLYVSNLFATNIIAGNTYVSNFFATNVLIYQNAYVSNFFATNIFSTLLVASNFYVTNLYANNIHINQIFAQSTFITNNLFRLTNYWTWGPTGAVDLWYSRQRFRASTPCYISGLLSRTNFATSEVLLSIDNIAATNIWLTATNGFKFAAVGFGAGTNTVVITNGTTGKFWIEYDPSGGNSTGESNIISRQMNGP